MIQYPPGGAPKCVYIGSGREKAAPIVRAASFVQRIFITSILMVFTMATLDAACGHTVCEAVDFFRQACHVKCVCVCVLVRRKSQLFSMV